MNDMAAEQKRVHLEVNDSGGWRRVTSFDLADFEDGDIEQCAEHLLEMSCTPRLKARIIIPGDTAPLVTWTKKDGWREWVHPGERAQREFA
jgi:hypothetical protein